MDVPVPTKPKLGLPADSCDSHCHLFGPRSKFPPARESPSENPAATIEALKRAHGILGIERAVLVQTPAHGTDNTIILDAISAGNGRYRGVGRADQTVTDAQLHALHDGGIRGLRFEFLKHFDAPPGPAVIQRIAERVRSMGWHLVFLLDGHQLLEMEQLLRSLPVPIIIDHLARIDIGNGIEHQEFRLLVDLLEEGKAWTKITAFGRLSKAGFPYGDVIPFAARAVEKAPNRILWGTDWPHPGPAGGPPPDDGPLVDLLPDIVPDQDRLKKILVDNPAVLYGFDN